MMAVTGRHGGHGNGGGRRINVREAQVRTVQASIRALTINDKQVTLAVFRQLLLKGLMDGTTVTFRGLPWGTVNYHPDDDCRKSSRPHYHVVWQEGDELRRDTIYQNDVAGLSPFYCKTRDAIPVMQRVLRGLALLRGEGRATEPMRESIDEQPKIVGGSIVGRSGNYYISRYLPGDYYPNLMNRTWLEGRCLDELACWPVVYEPLHAKYVDQYDKPGGSQDNWYERSQQHEHRKAYEQCVARVQAIIGDWTEETARAELERLEAVQRRLEEAWAQRWAEIEALDQLFIAV